MDGQIFLKLQSNTIKFHKQEIIAVVRWSMENAKEVTKKIQKSPKLQRIAKEMACEFFGKEVIEAELDQAAL